MTVQIQFDSKNLVHLPIDQIKPNPKNRNTHPEEQIDRLRKLMEYQGFRQPLIISNQSGLLVVGHGRLIAAQRMGMKSVPVIYQDFESPEQEYAFAVSDNAIAEWSDLELDKITKDLDGFNLDIDMLGIKDFSLDDLGLPDSEIEIEEEEESEEDLEPGCDEDEIPEPSPEPTSRLGDVFELGRHKLIVGDNLGSLKTLPDNSIDSLVTDPPAGISFMGKGWDEDKGGRKHWIAWMRDVMQECLRVMKPGAHGLIWAIPRTSHWTATALEDAGFEVRDVVTHIFGSGFPKSLNISIAIDKSAGVMSARGKAFPTAGRGERVDIQEGSGWTQPNEHIGITDAAKQWAGWGTALKPASEHWVLVRKPIAEDTVAENVLEHGTGGINIDASRIGNEIRQNAQKDTADWSGNNWSGKPQKSTGTFKEVTGRFPANLVLSHNPDCVEVGTKKVRGSKPSQRDNPAGLNPRGDGLYGASSGVTDCTGYASEDGTETVAAWECTEGCAVKLLDEQSIAGGMHPAGKAKEALDNFDREKSIFGIGRAANSSARFGDSGGASRFFLCVKSAISSQCGPKNTRDGDMFAGKKTASKKDSLRTDGCGNNQTGQYQMGTISITRTKTLSIISFPILNASTKISIGTAIIETEKTIEQSLAENVEGVSVVSSTESLIHFKDGSQEPIKGTVKIALEKNLENGEIKTENAIMLITESIELSGTRFFYCAKASGKDKGEGNLHPTVKSTALMSYFVKMVTPPNGVVLDVFGGSGTTLITCEKIGFKSNLMELSEGYADIIINRWCKYSGKEAYLLKADGSKIAWSDLASKPRG